VLTRISMLVLALLLSPTLGHSQIIACSNIAGSWSWPYYGSTFSLSQDIKGNISGYVIESGCQGNNKWPITGTFTGGYFTMTATNNGCTNSNATSISYKGNVDDPGCNYIYGSWTNSLGSYGVLGDSNPYPTSSDWLTKPVDVPTGETSATPTGAQWSPANSAPWNQKLAPDSPPGEFEGRTVYEYSGTGPGNDTCWFPGSAVPVFDAITTPGFGWLVSSKNEWGADFIGWNLAAVQYLPLERAGALQQ
jgi:hypothetical protein